MTSCAVGPWASGEPGSVSNRVAQSVTDHPACECTESNRDAEITSVDASPR